MQSQVGRQPFRYQLPLGQTTALDEINVPIISAAHVRLGLPLLGSPNDFFNDYHVPVSNSCSTFSARPCASFHSSRPLALRPSTTQAAVLGELKASTAKIERKLDQATAKKDPIQKIPNDEKTFRFLLNEDAMATEKLAEGIRLFAADIVKLEKKILSKL